ncbi:MAG: stage II sporulation protein M, partial [Steroidobacteraceae bacterium]
ALRSALLRRADAWKQARSRAERLGTGAAADADEAFAAIDDYRALARDLGAARKLLPASRAREFLEAAYAQSHGALHRPATHAGYALWSLFRDQIPAVVTRLRPHIAWVTALFVACSLAGAWLVRAYPELIGLFASPDMIATVERGDLWTDSILTVVPAAALSLQILTNNIVVSLFAFCAGCLFGLGTFYIIGLNALTLGAMFEFTAQHGLQGRLFEFVAAHGFVELACVCLAGAAGAAVGEALVRPGAATRGESFRRTALECGKLLVEIVILLLGCGVIEGFVSPDPDIPLWVRLVIGIGYFVLMIAALRGWLFGRSRDPRPIAY